MSSPRKVESPLPQLDRRLLEALHAHRALTTTQAIELTGRAQRTVLERLRALRRDGLVDRARPSAEKGSAPFHWWVTSAGRTVLGYESRVRPKQNKVPFLQHTVGIAAVPLGLRQFSMELEPLRWLRDEHGWEPRPLPKGAEQITPDGYALVRVLGEDAEIGLWVEIDRYIGRITSWWSAR